MLIGVKHAAAATADPPLEPPAVTDAFQGLGVAPNSAFCVTGIQPSGGEVVLPMRMGPVRNSGSTTAAFSFGTTSAKSGLPKVVRTPAVGNVSLTEKGMPNVSG